MKHTHACTYTLYARVCVHVCVCAYVCVCVSSYFLRSVVSSLTTIMPSVVFAMNYHNLLIWCFWRMSWARRISIKMNLSDLSVGKNNSFSNSLSPTGIFDLWGSFPLTKQVTNQLWMPLRCSDPFQFCHQLAGYPWGGSIMSHRLRTPPCRCQCQVVSYGVAYQW